MAVFVIEHADGDKWFAQWGWVPSADAALRFASHAEARDFAAATAPARAGQVKAYEPKEDAAGNRLFGVKTDYDPFGTGAANG